MAKSSPKKVDLRGTGMRNRRIASDSDLHIALLEAQGSAEALLRNYQAISVAHPELSEVLGILRRETMLILDRTCASTIFLEQKTSDEEPTL